MNNNKYFEPRPVEPFRALAWLRIALEMMTRRLPMVLLVSVTVYVVIRALTQFPLPPIAAIVGPILLLPLALAAGVHIYARDWWSGDPPRPWRECLRTLLHSAIVLLVLHVVMALVQWLDTGNLDAAYRASGPLVRLLLPASLATLELAAPQSALTIRLLDEPLAIAALATMLGVSDCWFVPLLVRYAHAPADAAVPLARRAMARNRGALIPVLIAVLVGARIVGAVPTLAGLYFCFVAALAAASFRDIFGQRDELEPVERPQEVRSV